MGLEILARRRELKIFFFERDLANEQLEKTRPLKPPMPKQLGIERGDDDWIDIERRDLAQLPATLLEKMIGVRIGRLFRRLAIVQFLFQPATGDAVIFHAGKFSHSARDRTEMFERQFPSDVAIKFAIGRIARITFLCAPNLPARIAIPRERGRPAGV